MTSIPFDSDILSYAPRLPTRCNYATEVDAYHNYLCRYGCDREGQVVQQKRDRRQSCLNPPSTALIVSNIASVLLYPRHLYRLRLITERGRITETRHVSYCYYQ